MKILLTGSTGFIGAAIARSIISSKLEVIAAVRELPTSIALSYKGASYQVVGPIDNQTEWCQALCGVDTVVHCAASTNVMHGHGADVLAAYRKVNVDGTLRLAKQAVENGVRRFIFLSSIKVNGEYTLSGQAFNELSIPKPEGPYGQSKLEAEDALLKLATITGMEVVIIRPPLVYGPGVKGNFARMLKWVKYGLPLPFGTVNNQRSLVALDNLVSLVLLCINRNCSPQAANQVFLVTDNKDVSTTTLLEKVAQAAGRSSFLLPVPIGLLRFGISLLGKPTMAQRLLDNLQVDATKASDLLGWQPLVTIDEQLSSMFKKPKKRSKFILFQNNVLFRVLDLMLAGMGLFVLWPLLLLLYFLGLFDTGSPFFRQERVGLNLQPFVLIKFRTMRVDTISIASHLVRNESITSFGKFLRRTKLDELPQLWNVLCGEMSLVGPRPGLFNQHKLTKARTTYGIFSARPGITGLAQINGIDMSTPELLAKTDARMLKHLNIRNYFKFIVLTVIGKGIGDAVVK